MSGSPATLVARTLGYFVGAGALFAAAPSAWLILALASVGALAVALAERGRLRPWVDLAAGLAAAACAVLAGTPGSTATGLLAAGGTVLLAACAILPSATAPRARALPAGAAWLAAGALVALGVWLPAWLGTRGQLAPLDPATAPGLLVRVLGALALLAAALVAWTLVRGAGRKVAHHEAHDASTNGVVKPET